MQNALKAAIFLVLAAVIMLGGGLLTADPEVVEKILSQSSAARQLAD